MKLISLLAVLCLMYSCEEKRVSPKMELRQMQYSQNKDEVTKGTFFFIGSFSKQTTEEFKVRIFAEEKGMYSFYELNMNNITISINPDSTANPYMNVYYTHRVGNEEIPIRNLINNTYKVSNVNIVVPEKYFPSEFSKIQLR